jgi:hypothetical protein
VETTVREQEVAISRRAIVSSELRQRRRRDKAGDISAPLGAPVLEAVFFVPVLKRCVDDGRTTEVANQTG